MVTNKRQRAVIERASDDAWVAELAARSLGLGSGTSRKQDRYDAIVKALNVLGAPIPGGKRFLRISGEVRRLVKGSK